METFAVYLLSPDGETYGPPIVSGVPYNEAAGWARDLAVDQFGPDGFTWDRRGAVKKGRPGAPSLNVLIWSSLWKRD